MQSTPNAISTLAERSPGTTSGEQEHEVVERAGHNRPGVARNVGPLDRVLRVTLGGALAIWAALRLLDGGGLAGLLADIALIALGLDFVVTGIRGHCPLYERLGWSTAKRRTRR